MAIISEVARDMALDSDVDADSSPLGMGSAGTVSTPDTEVTPPESPVQEHRSHLSSERLWAKKKLSQLTQEEKVSLLTAADFWRTKAINSKGIPAAKTSDGPNGARGGIFVGGTKDLLYEVGQHLANEVKARSAHILLAPTVCMHRHPLGGRNFESFSEDPLLTGKLAAQYIQGLQQKGVAATIKHFVGNEQETHRLTIDSIVQERPLRELYLKPFEIAVREANPWAIMSSYNLVNGVHADMNKHTLKDILRGEWGYDGTVISDWGGINSTVESIVAGCDIEFPFSTNWRFEKVLDALKSGDLLQADIDQAAENALTLVHRVTGGEAYTEEPERQDNRAETRELIREAGTQGLTLLKNEGGILPINPKTAKLAVIGPNANRAIAGGGGSASLNPYYNTLPLESIKKAAEQEVIYAQGCHINKWLPVASPYCKTEDGKPGVTIDWFVGDQFKGAPVVQQRRTNTDLFLWDSAPLAQVGPEWSAIARTSLTPTITGKHTISFMSVGPGKLYLNDKLALDLWDWTEEGEAMFDGSVDYLVEVDMEAGKAVELKVEMTNELRPISKQKQFNMTHKYGGCRIGFKQEDKVDYLQEAIEAAKQADVAVVIVGLDAEWESEGYDRQTMDLPSDGSQDRLVQAVVKANPNTVVVNQSGSPVTMPWVDEVPAIVQAWYQGQEAGNALADVLFGFKNPSGKLPCTFPKALTDTPAYHNWPGENLGVVYGEGLYIGYRHYERANIAPLFPFGHGLSYTTFEYGRPSLSARVLSEGEPLELLMAVSNIGDVDGFETVQIYVRDEKSRLPRPEKELVSFEKVFLERDQTKHLKIRIDKYAVGYYDTSLKAWIAEEGKFEVLIGASSADIRRKISFEVKESFTWVF
ncbi:glycosyl hydrolase family 3 N terminal domain-containing protein [Diaporthe amygdali]|uniref:glycosyl hydrolase family 3 N terminal domain-containing protein n=1 Tax=Phomopsis amygdali TaxID=1214568 RepID=UPI0022FE71E4|nr:glycosyl hydrolase family 3 N terminal domain-containing protein [Diaporthe amygdali]KAJ0122270.1 glycosyl hydrolase family 3 N terminal domain-containing protein [Diaporthe amygdali]